MKIIKKYKIYFLISLFIFLIFFIKHILSSNFNLNSIFNYRYLVLTLLGCFLAPFLYAVEYFIYTYILEPDLPVSKNFRELLKKKGPILALEYGDFNKVKFEGTILRSVILSFSLLFLSFFTTFGNINMFSKTFVITFLAINLYLQIKSFTNNNYLDWYENIDFKPTLQQAQIILGVKSLIFVILLFF